MNHLESGFENDPYKPLVDRFVTDMGLISQTIGVMSGGYTDRRIQANHNTGLREELLLKFPKITNHPLKGSQVRVILSEESLVRDNAVVKGLPWAGGEPTGEETVEGILSDIFPGIGIFISKGPNLQDGRFVHTTSYINGEPTCEIEVLGIPDQLDEVK